LTAAYAGGNIGGVLIPSGGAVPDPRTQGFVIEVENFTDFEAAIGSKVAAIVRPDVVPLPAGAVLFISGIAALGGLRASRRRKSA
jgi:hypothetical protein